MSGGQGMGTTEFDAAVREYREAIDLEPPNAWLEEVTLRRVVLAAKRAGLTLRRASAALPGRRWTMLRYWATS